MTDRCPTCGQVLPVSRDADCLLLALQRHGGDGKPRMVYRGNRTHLWYVNYKVTGEPPAFTYEAVRDLMARGLLNSVYDTAPEDAYWLHPTLNVMEERAKRQSERQRRPAPKDRDALRAYNREYQRKRRARIRAEAE